MCTQVNCPGEDGLDKFISCGSETLSATNTAVKYLLDNKQKTRTRMDLKKKKEI